MITNFVAMRIGRLIMNHKRAYVFKTSDDDKSEVIEFENFEDFCESLIDPECWGLIISKPDSREPWIPTGCDWVIEIYDDWRE